MTHPELEMALAVTKLAVALAVAAAVLLDASFVEGGALVPTVGIAMFVLFGGLWFALPLWRRRFSRR